MKKHLLLGIFVLSALCLSAENAEKETAVVQIESLKKTAVESARFEILANDRIAFKLDKFTGDVYQLISRGLFSPYNWVLMERNLGGLNDLVHDNEINYQLFMHEENGSFIFLMNVHTGATWTLGHGGVNKPYAWEPIVDIQNINE
ncbi:MAG: hypothetical protein IIX13_05305 [Bacteroidales bacterium]|jgi:hypothetical protein|nr:hypothetical protein [Bacteroidales bacterium]